MSRPPNATSGAPIGGGSSLLPPRRPGARLRHIRRINEDGSARDFTEAKRRAAGMPWADEFEFIGHDVRWFVWQERE